MPAVNNWRIIVSPYDSNLRSAKFECPRCRQSMLTTDPDKAVFVHCSGRRDFLTLEQREMLAGTPGAEERQAAQNHAALERTANATLQPRWNSDAAWKAEEAKMRADADAFERARREQELYNLTHPTPRQPTGGNLVGHAPYTPGAKDC